MGARQRIVIVGAGGSGKTTVGREAAHRIGVPFTDLDTLFWKPGWQRSDPNEFRSAVRARIGMPSWVIVGNYRTKVGDLTWPAADLLVWLDLPRRITFPRVLRRTFVDALFQRELWPGCRQHWNTPFHTGLISYTWRQPAMLRATYPRLIDDVAAQTLRLTRRADITQWLESLQRSGIKKRGSADRP